MTRPPAPGTAPVIGLDLGGTKIAAALVGPDGTVLRRHTRPTPARAGATVLALGCGGGELEAGA
ncbi:ROK family protein, partial [Streptomyces sp. NPDC004069]